jgi:hypothetical protein
MSVVVQPSVDVDAGAGPDAETIARGPSEATAGADARAGGKLDGTASADPPSMKPHKVALKNIKAKT